MSVSGVGVIQSYGEEMAGSVSFAPCAVCARGCSPHFENFLIRKIIPIFPFHLGQNKEPYITNTISLGVEVPFFGVSIPTYSLFLFYKIHLLDHHYFLLLPSLTLPTHQAPSESIKVC